MVKPKKATGRPTRFRLVLASPANNVGSIKKLETTDMDAVMRIWNNDQKSIEVELTTINNQDRRKKWSYFCNTITFENIDQKGGPTPFLKIFIDKH